MIPDIVKTTYFGCYPQSNTLIFKLNKCIIIIIIINIIQYYNIMHL